MESMSSLAGIAVILQPWMVYPSIFPRECRHRIDIEGSCSETTKGAGHVFSRCPRRAVSFELEAHQVHVQCFDDAPNHGAQNSKRRYSASNDPSKRCFSSKIWRKPRLVIFSQNKGKRRIPSWERPTCSQAQNRPPGLKIFWSTAGSRSWIITNKNH